MLKIITTLTMFLLGIAAQAQVSENRKVSGFSKIDVKNGIELIYTQSDEGSLTVQSANAEDLKNVITEFKNGTLKISTRGNKKNATVIVYVSAKEIEKFRAGSKAKIVLTSPITSDHLVIMLNSGATFNGVTKTKGKTTLYANPGTVYNGRSESAEFNGNFNEARINLSGTSGKAKISASQNAYCAAKNFVTDHLKITASEHSWVVAHAEDNLTLDVSDSSYVTFFGKPTNINVYESTIPSDIMTKTAYSAN